MSRDARDVLADALEVELETRRAVERAEKAVNAAVGIAAAFSAEAAGYIDADTRLASERAASVKAMIAEGRAPQFVPSTDAAEIAAKRAEAKSQLASVEIVVADLERDAQAAWVAAKAANEATGAAVRAVIREDASAMAVEIERLEAEALALRAKLHGSQFVPGLPVPPALSEVERRVIGKNGLTDIIVRNTATWRSAEEYGARWRELVSRLHSDPAARLDGGRAA